MVKLPEQMLSVDNYFAFEASGDVRHEYVSGLRHAIAGETGQHNRIAGNISAQFWTLALEKPYRVYQEGMKLRTSEQVFYYPDVMVACGVPLPDPYFETEPCILVEVLSRSTKDIDLREKLLSYKSLPSVQLYLIVDSERLAVKHYWRAEDGTWNYQEHAGDGDIDLPGLDGILTLPQMYRNVF